MFIRFQLHPQRTVLNSYSFIYETFFSLVSVLKKVLKGLVLVFELIIVNILI